MAQTVEHTVALSASPAQVFGWYTDLENVRRMTPPELHLRILRAETPLRAGSRVLFSIRPKFIPLEINWLLQVEAFEEGARFSERLITGPFEHWVHRHEFHPTEGGGCRLVDHIEWDKPAFLVRAVASDEYINSKLMETFHFRERVLRAAFESVQPAAAR
jgi:ligand-binding SRPBCC domain-containing protein